MIGEGSAQPAGVAPPGVSAGETVEPSATESVSRNVLSARHSAFTSFDLMWLGLFTLLAAVLRLYRLGDWSLWVDEAHTFRDIVAPNLQFWGSEVSRYPLSYLLLRTLHDVGMPVTEAWLRLPFAFFGILSIPAIGLLGRGLVGKRAALLAALMLAISPWHIYWSQNARSYAMVLFVALLAAGIFFDGMRRRSPFTLVAALGLTIVAGLCHPSAYILLSGLLAYGFFVDRGGGAVRSTVQKWLPAIILVMLAVLAVLLLPLIQHVRRVKPDFSLFHLVQTMVFYVRWPVIVAAIGGVLLLFDRGDRVGAFLLSWIVVPLVALAVLASGVIKVNAQYVFYTLPAFYLLAAAVIVALADGIRGRGFRGFLLRAVPLGILLFDLSGQTYLYFQKNWGERPRWREACEFIAAQPGVAKTVLTTNDPSMRYYCDPLSFAGEDSLSSIDVVGMSMDKFVTAGGGSAFMTSQITSARESESQLYIVLTEPELDEWDRGGILDGYIRSRFLQRRRFPCWTGPKDMTVLVYLLPKQPR